MSILIVIGSTRPRSITKSLGILIADYLTNKHSLEAQVLPLDYITPAYLGAFFDDEVQNDLKEKFSQASGVIFCTPEYNGSFSSALMAVIENLGYPVAFENKPILVFGVAGGSLGATKAIAHLQSVCSHSGAIVLPGALSISAANEKFGLDGTCSDEEVKVRIFNSLDRMISFLGGMPPSPR